jgi:glycosyltransferase involved in cell wall biosynthesis
MKKITIGVPVYKAKNTIDKLLASILIQSMYEDITIILANDYPEDNGSYEYVKKLYPTLDIKILDCEKNTGPGLARQRALDACKTDWITFMDADDILISPFSIEDLYNNITPTSVEVQGPFFQEVKEGCMNAAERM